MGMVRKGRRLSQQVILNYFILELSSAAEKFEVWILETISLCELNAYGLFFVPDFSHELKMLLFFFLRSDNPPPKHSGSLRFQRPAELFLYSCEFKRMKRQKT